MDAKYNVSLLKQQTMAITTYDLQEKIEKLFRQEWMRNDDWIVYLGFLFSKGFNYDHILENFHDESVRRPNRLDDYINDYVASLL